MLILMSVILPVSAQNSGGGFENRPASPKTAAVAYLFPEQVSVTADKPSQVDLHFKVADGLHVNSHTPRTEDLIPTTLNLPESSGVHFTKTAFPPGTDFAFPINPGEKLSVYTNEFTVHAEVVASKGNHLVEATLHYQACNSNTCMPPHSIPVVIDVIAK